MDRVFWIDLIRVVSAFFVIAIHVCGRVGGGYDESGTTLTWLFSRCCHELSHVAVPLFIMISGALLLGREETLLTFYRKRFGKILWSFFAWCYIYVLCRYITGLSLEDGTPITLISTIGTILVPQNANGHFWFIPMLLSLYLVTPFLSVFVRNASKNMLTFFLVLWFLAVVIFPVTNNVAKDMLGIARIDFRFEFVSHWLGFFIAGYALKDFVLSKRWATVAIFSWFFLAIATPVNVYLREFSSAPTSTSFYNFWENYILSITSHQIVISLLAFLIMRSLGDIASLSYSRFGHIVSAVAPLTFGIYLIHMLFVTPITRILALGSDASWLAVLFAIPILTILIYLTSGGMIYLIRKVPYLRLLAP